MLDCRQLDFSPRLAAARMDAAEEVFGKPALRRIIAFTLFVLGVNRARIAEVLGMPDPALPSQPSAPVPAPAPASQMTPQPGPQSGPQRDPGEEPA